MFQLAGATCQSQPLSVRTISVVDNLLTFFECNILDMISLNLVESGSRENNPNHINFFNNVDGSVNKKLLSDIRIS